MWENKFENRANWEDMCMSLAFLLSQKSIDPSTVHGAFLVDKNHRPLSYGFNGPIAGSDDSAVPLNRPDKYFHMIHAEENCILNYHGSQSQLKGARMYITGRPCHRCLRMMIQKGIESIAYGPVGSKVVDEDDMKAQEQILLQHPYISIWEFDSDRISKVKDLFNKTQDYIDYKCSQ